MSKENERVMDIEKVIDGTIKEVKVKYNFTFFNGIYRKGEVYRVKYIKEQSRIEVENNDVSQLFYPENFIKFFECK